MSVKKKWADKTTAQPQLVIWTLFLLLSLIWGSSFIMMKRGLEAFGPFQVAMLRISIAGLLLLVPALRAWRRIPKRAVGALALTGLMGTAIPALMFPLAQTQMDSGIVGVMNAMTPLFAFLIGGLFFGQTLRRRPFLGVILGLVGAALLILAGSKGALGFNIYGLFALVGTACYGFNVNWVKTHLQELKAFDVSTVSLAFLLPIGILGVYMTDVWGTLETVPAAPNALLYIILLGSVATAFALVLFNYLIKLSTAVFASSVSYFIPVVALMWGLFDGESILALQWVGIVAVVAGVYFVKNA